MKFIVDNTVVDLTLTWLGDDVTERFIKENFYFEEVLRGMDTMLEVPDPAVEIMRDTFSAQQEMNDLEAKIVAHPKNVAKFNQIMNITKNKEGLYSKARCRIALINKEFEEFLEEEEKNNDADATLRNRRAGD